eukprot:3115055-Prymnesium_polylepis.1
MSECDARLGFGRCTMGPLRSARPPPRAHASRHGTHTRVGHAHGRRGSRLGWASGAARRRLAVRSGA